MTPKDAIANTPTRVLLHLISGGRSTVRSCAEAADTNVSNAHRHLTLLRDEGLITWDKGSHGTLRPLVRPVPFDDGPSAA